MTDIIHLLSDSVANQIAAGEVIQRPASVVKELVENAIDAGATKIQVQLKDAGRTLIQVIDNGKGMSPTDARMAFERHATSKIRNAADLFAIHTMGFRGEALASIASVADVEMKTKRENDEIGTSIHIAASEVISQTSVATTNGTIFMVRNLFFNVPARRKFLKSNATEVRLIVSELQRVSLANPEIAFGLHHNGALLFDLPVSNFKQRIVHLFGNSMNHSLVPIRNETSLALISGFIGQPKYARRVFGEQFFFVNGRYMKHPFFHKGIMQAYERILPKEMIPAYFIAFEVDPAAIDINIHPTKTEIKFENESAIWQLLHAAVKEGLGKFNMIPSIDFDQQGSIDIPLMPRSTDGLTMPGIQINPNYNPFEEGETKSGSHTNRVKHDDVAHWEKLYGTPEERQSFQQPQQEVQNIFPHLQTVNPAEHNRNFIQFKNKYILTPVKSGLMIIDQRRAHQRILFERIMISLNQHQGVSQQLLFPQTLETNAADAALLIPLLEDLNHMGFDIREFGTNTFIINGVPGIMDNSDAVGMIEGLLESFKSSAANLKERSLEQLATALAVAAAINYGTSLNQEEISSLIDSLFACQTPNYSPTGKPVLEIIPTDELEKKLK